MKDAEFIELLNLYLDHEISAEDATRLEAEVLQNPQRRTLYQDYCRMQKACKMLAEDFADEAVPSVDKVVAFPSAQRGSRIGWIAVGGFAAVAACLAVVFVNTKRSEPAAATPAVAVRESVNIPAQSLANNDRRLPRTVSVPTSHDDAPSGLAASLSLANNKQPQPSPLFVAAEAQAPQFAWMDTVQLNPVNTNPTNSLRFEGRAPLRNDANSAAKRLQNQGRVEWNAIRWQK